MNSAEVELADVMAAFKDVGSMLAADEQTLLEGPASFGGEFGQYEGLPPRIELGDDGRSGTLLAPLKYIQPSEIAWPVPAGAWLDGASIPRALWSLVGGPYEGKYRNASIIHDYYCITRSQSWRDVHHMFHDAMRCSGVGRAKAAVLYYAVYRFGPRWTERGLEGLSVAVTPEPIDRGAIESFTRDAEAILQHEIGADAIASLAEVRADQASSARAKTLLESAEGPSGTSQDRASLLVIPGGSGTAEDVTSVTAEARKLPDWVTEHFFNNQVRIVACRNSVTDFETDLQGKIPRGWETIGRTWDSVPGSYFDNRKRVVIATIEHEGLRVVPDKTAGLHGSDSLVIHEALHGYDYSTQHSFLKVPGFRSARDQDQAGLTTYENQAGQAGLEETFAETGAQFCVQPAALAARCPTLIEFWDAMPNIEEGAAAPLPAPLGRQPIGSVTREDGGALVFDLRAEGPGGAIGHASLIVTPAEPEHHQLEKALFPDTGGLEGIRTTTALFYG
jgi:Protein of unknown function (DUF1353)